MYKKRVYMAPAKFIPRQQDAEARRMQIPKLGSAKALVGLLWVETKVYYNNNDERSKKRQFIVMV